MKTRKKYFSLNIGVTRDITKLYLTILRTSNTKKIYKNPLIKHEKKTREIITRKETFLFTKETLNCNLQKILQLQLSLMNLITKKKKKRDLPQRSQMNDIIRAHLLQSS